MEEPSEIDPKLLEILVCPLTKAPLRYDRAAQELISEEAGLAYPIRDGIPIMLVDEARFELATALFGSGDREAALDELLGLFKRDREWNEQAARKQLVKFFEAMGPTDPLTLSGRRRLSAQMFS